MGRDADGVATHLDLATFIFTRTPYDPAAPVPGGVERLAVTRRAPLTPPGW